MIKLKDIYISKSPSSVNKVRLSGEIIYENSGPRSEIIWFEVDAKYSDYISTSGNPWLTCLLPLAVTIGEPVRLSLPVDKTLLENARKLMRIWKEWHPHLHIVPVEADIDDAVEYEENLRTASFFSGGVDSFFTVLRHDKVSDSKDSNRIDDLLTVWGFDIPIHDRDSFRNMQNTFEKAASGLGKTLITISTNIRETRWKQANWGQLSHGSALAGAAHALGKRYRNILIASTGGYHDQAPWGSHVLTDRLLSGSKLTIIHYGPEFRRTEKTETVSRSREAMESLHVCHKLGNDRNCSRCIKCFRTMITLDIFGVLDQFKTFDITNYNMNNISRICMLHKYDYMYMSELRELASRRNRTDIVRAIDRSFNRSKKMKRYVEFCINIKNKLHRAPILWRWDDALLRLLLKNSIA